MPDVFTYVNKNIKYNAIWVFKSENNIFISEQYQDWPPCTVDEQQETIPETKLF